MFDSDTQVSNGGALVGYLSTHPMQTSAACLLLMVFYCIISSIVTAFKPGLKSIPGPALARYSSLYRPWMLASGKAPNVYQELHSRYGWIVRTGPKTVDISDPAAASVIYGINSKFLKASEPWNPFYIPSHQLIALYKQPVTILRHLQPFSPRHRDGKHVLSPQPRRAPSPPPPSGAEILHVFHPSNGAIRGRLHRHIPGRNAKPPRPGCGPGLLATMVCL